jgi:hypothetical protein
MSSLNLGVRLLTLSSSTSSRIWLQLLYIDSDGSDSFLYTSSLLRLELELASGLQ